MKHPLQVRGAVMVLALLILLASTLLLAGWAHVLSTQVLNSRSAEQAVHRRVSLLNARSMAVQYALNTLPGGTVNAASFTLTNTLSNAWTNQWGTMQWNTTRNVNAFTHAASNDLFNQFSPGRLGGFALINNITLTALGETVPLQIRYRFSSPQEMGYALVFARGATASDGYRTPGVGLAFLSPGSAIASNYQSPTAFTFGVSNPIAFPAVPITAGSGNGTGPTLTTNLFAGAVGVPFPLGTAGRLLVNDTQATTNDGIIYSPQIEASTNATNRTITIHLDQLTNAGAGNTTFVMHKLNASRPTNQINISNITLDIFGSSDANRSPVMLTFGAYDATDTNAVVPLRRIRLRTAINNRPLAIFVRGNNDAGTNRFTIEDVDNNDNWNMNLTLIRSNMRLDFGGSGRTLFVRGGIWTASPMDFTNGTLVATNANPGSLRNGLQRLGWIEAWEPLP